VISALGDTAIYLLGATSAAGLNLKGAYLLQWSAISWLKSRGFHFYDLGGINPQRNPGVYHFKSGLGAEESEQVGTYDLVESWPSAVLVKAGEQIQSLQRKTKAWLAGKAPVFARARHGA
jgi:lipid II:glycine glycyltransferase (peptidoglycan interpeptide bridge formation enzyme)